MSICEIRNLLLIAMVTSVCACERKNSDVAEVETDMTEVSNWLTSTDKTARYRNCEIVNNRISIGLGWSQHCFLPDLKPLITMNDFAE